MRHGDAAIDDRERDCPDQCPEGRARPDGARAVAIRRCEPSDCHRAWGRCRHPVRPGGGAIRCSNSKSPCRLTSCHWPFVFSLSRIAPSCRCRAAGRRGRTRRGQSARHHRIPCRGTHRDSGGGHARRREARDAQRRVLRDHRDQDVHRGDAILVRLGNLPAILGPTRRLCPASCTRTESAQCQHQDDEARAESPRSVDDAAPP